MGKRGGEMTGRRRMCREKKKEIEPSGREEQRSYSVSDRVVKAVLMSETICWTYPECHQCKKHEHLYLISTRHLECTHEKTEKNQPQNHYVSTYG
jgi:hypothetical protein